MTTIQISPLEVQDPGFMVTSTIERCPKVMMPRELVKNAIEAAMKASAGTRIVEVRVVEVQGCQKLCFWNAGPGLDHNELRAMTNLASSIGKQLSLTENFGMGAKVASLPSNQLGMRYRSCKNGHVHQVTLAKQNGIYGRIRYKFADGHLDDVADVTEHAREEGCDLSFDWTDVTLFGNCDDQNTVTDPYDRNPEVNRRQWLQDELYHRFYRLPEGLQIIMQPGTHRLSGRRVFKTLRQRIDDDVFAQHEAIPTEAGIVIHYLYDRPDLQASAKEHNIPMKGAMPTDASTCAIVYRDEMYGVKKGRAWTKDAPMFGITFGAKHLSVHIELPDDYPVVADSYRQFLRFAIGTQDQVEVVHFAVLALQHCPQWVRNIIREFAPDNAGGTNDIRDKLQELLNDLRIPCQGPRSDPQGINTAIPQIGGPGMESDRRGLTPTPRGGLWSEASLRAARPTDLTSLPHGARRASTYENAERAPEIIYINTPEEAAEKGLEGRAACYMPEANLLIVNKLYPAFTRMQEVLEAIYADVADPETMRALVQQQTEKAITLRIGRAVVFAKAKALSSTWTLKDISQVMSPESLSIVADDYRLLMQTARHSLGQRLRPGGRPGL
jgi:hypothetical protein